PPTPTPLPSTTLFRSEDAPGDVPRADVRGDENRPTPHLVGTQEVLAALDRVTERRRRIARGREPFGQAVPVARQRGRDVERLDRSEEHTSELQSRENL